MELLPLNGSRRDTAPTAPRPTGARPGTSEPALPTDDWLPSAPPASVPAPRSEAVREAPPVEAERPLKPSATARALLGLDAPKSGPPSVLLQDDAGKPLTMADVQAGNPIEAARASKTAAPAAATAAPVQAAPTKPLTGPSAVAEPEQPGLLRSMADASRRIGNAFMSLVGKGDDSIPLEAPLARINALGPKYAAMSDTELKGMTAEFKARIANGESLDALMPEAYAVCREAAGRVLGMKPFDVQVMGAIAMQEGKIAEMGTGEGKTLTATMPAYLNGLSGKGAHVVTVNQTLAERDAANMGKLYNWLGLSVGVVPQEPEKTVEKRAAYNADITYTTNYSLGFDFLRDNMVHNPEDKVCRAPNFALVDEVDEILIDEARTPLILSKMQAPSTKEYQQFAQVMKDLRPGTDFQVDYKQRQAWLTDEGLDVVEKRLSVDNLYDDKNVSLVPYLRASLIANTLFTKDKDYMIRDGKIEIVDEFTGRVMDGRRYNDGIHQALEAKEGVDVQPEQQTMASITYPNLFRRYEKVAGMSGTAKTEESEFQDLYGMSVAVIPPNRTSKRIDQPDLVYKTYQEKFNAIGDYVQRLAEEGKPVLIATRNVATNEYLDQVLNARGIPHQLLNARSVQENTAAENEILARAGKSGMVTLATNMAGRGVDIKPDLVNFKMLTTEAVRAAQEGKPSVIVLSKKSEVDDARLWLGVNQLVTASAEPKVSEMAGVQLFAPVGTEQPGALATPHVQIVIDDGTPLPDMPGVNVLRSTEERFATGGLHVVGTERHESRRIDNQLKGRAGRQGSPGETQFFVSLDDELMRLFGGDRLKNVFDHLGVQQGQAVSDRMLDKAIASAQKKIEGMHFDVRKNTTKYDGVLNIHRNLFYKDREEIVGGADIDPMLRAWAGEGIDAVVTDERMGTRVKTEQAETLWTRVQEKFGLPDSMKPAMPGHGEKVEVAALRKHILDAIDTQLTAHKSRAGEALWKAGLKELTLDVMDEGWFNHLDNMAMMQSGIGLEAYAQQDPWIAYQKRGYEMWNGLKSDIEAQVLQTAIRG